MPPRREQSARGPENRASVVSPCTNCKNKRTSSTPEGYWPCPRKVWEERHKTQIEKSVPSYLAFAGGPDDQLVNPVYSEDHKLILIWTADIGENSAIYDADNNRINPDILDPKFDTKYIKCNELPSLPLETEVSYYQNGAYKEGEHLLVHPATTFQIPGSQEPLMIDGFAKRISLAFHHAHKRPDEDVVVSGM